MKDEIVVRWRCTAPRRNGDGQFNRIISCSNEAMMKKEVGWICDCGRWTKGDDAYHKPLKMGIRKIVDCKKLISEIKQLKSGFDVRDIIQISPEPKKRYLADTNICNFCKISGCPGSVRFDKRYFELGYIETSLPMCPHVEYEED